jgi:hypothetical protein
MEKRKNRKQTMAISTDSKSGAEFFYDKESEAMAI